jgi:hypothetical protein
MNRPISGDALARRLAVYKERGHKPTRWRKGMRFPSESRIVLLSHHGEFGLLEDLWPAALKLAREFRWAGHLTDEWMTAQDAYDLSEALEWASERVPCEEDWYDRYQLEYPFDAFAGPTKQVLLDLIDFTRRSRGFTVAGPEMVRVMSEE